MTAILECEDLTVGYGKVSVARNVSLSVAPGQVLAILGPNGAGKTSLILTLAGVLTPLGGTIGVAGFPIKGGSARRLNKAGIVLVPDSRALIKLGLGPTSQATPSTVPAALSAGGAATPSDIETFGGK